jgi:ATP-dependent DNA ligase
VFRCLGPLSHFGHRVLERRRHLQAIMPEGSAVISAPVSVIGRGHELFELMCAHDLEGIVAKRLQDPYSPRTRWLKIKNPSYSQNEGRRELFDRSVSASQPARRSAVASTAHRRQAG